MILQSTKPPGDRVRPIVGSYFRSFLIKDMQHVYRQLVGLQKFEAHVATHRRKNAALFAFDETRLHLLAASRLRVIRKIWRRVMNRKAKSMSALEVAQVSKTFDHIQPDVLHIYFGNIAVELLPLIESGRFPVVVSFHGSDATTHTQNREYSASLKRLFRSASLVLARSESLMDALEQLGCPASKLRLNLSSVPARSMGAGLRKPPLEENHRFLQACRLVEKKGVEVTIRAFHEVLKIKPASTLTLAGDGPLSDSMKKLAESLGIAHAVHFLGFVDQSRLMLELGKAHIFLHPSVTAGDGNCEGIPNAMLEAMESGMPVIATRHGGIPEVIDDSVTGLLVDEFDIKGLTSKMLELMENPELFERISKNGRDKVRQKFEVRHQISVLENYYEEAMRLFHQGNPISQNVE